MDFSSIIIVLAKLFFLLVVGYALNRTHVLDSRGNKAISALLVNATNPALVIGAMAATDGVAQDQVLKVIIMGVGIYILLPVLAFVIVRVFRIDIKKRGTAQLLLIFGNTGFMAIPVLQALYGDVSVFYCNIMNMPFNFLIYSYGVYLLSKDAALQGIEYEDGSKPSFSWKLFLSPGIIASALALIMYFAKIRLPQNVSDTFLFLGNTTPPLSMLLLGSVLAEYPLKSVFADLKINFMILAKHFVMPVMVFLLAKLIFTDPVIVGIATLTFAMPCGTMCAILSKEKGGDTLTASGGVVFSTLLSLITIPIVYLILGPLF